MGLTTPPCKNSDVMIPSKNQTQTRRIGYKLGRGKRSVELRRRSIEKIRWTVTGQLEVGGCVIFYSGMDNRH